jgi:hypothetical protein
MTTQICDQRDGTPRLEVYHDRFLSASIETLYIGAFHAGRFHRDHVSAVVGENSRGKRARPQGGQVEHPNTVQRLA